MIHWVSATAGKTVSIRLYDRLFRVENPEAKDIENYRDCLNPDSLIEVSGAVVEPSVFEGSNLRFQFERVGYFYRDGDLTAKGNPVFNRTITLRDSWAG